MRIQISPNKRIADAFAIWPEAGPEVDLVLDPRPPYGLLKFRANTIKVIYAFGILGITKSKSVNALLQEFYKILMPDGELYIIEHDFDYICRAYLGGDLPLSEFNQDFRRTTYFNRDELVRLLEMVGFPEKNQRQWHGGTQFQQQHYEIIISGKKPNRK